MARSPARWMPRADWDALVRGDGCSMCAHLAAGAEVDRYSRAVAELDAGVLRLMADQYTPGYCVLVARRHVREPYHLPPHERSRFLADLMRAAAAIDEAFRPVKMNIELLGNAVPHLHGHLKPRYHGDAAPGAPLYGGPEPALVTEAEYAERVARIRLALARVS